MLAMDIVLHHMHVLPGAYLQRTRHSRAWDHSGRAHGILSNNRVSRTAPIVNGEGRSSNRTKWSSGEHTLEPEEKESSRLFSSSEIQNGRSKDIWEFLEIVRPEIQEIDRMVMQNMKRVQQAFRENRVGPHHFQGSTGYGHGDLGRCTLDDIMARIMGSESAAVRIQFVSGTHAIAAGLFACLRPGDELLSVAGNPYDTLEEVIGSRGEENCGNLKDFGVSYRTLDLREDGTVDFEALEAGIMSHTKVALIQRSCGYALRPTLTI